jgi:hypothetical protein
MATVLLKHVKPDEVLILADYAKETLDFGDVDGLDVKGSAGGDLAYLRWAKHLEEAFAQVLPSRKFTISYPDNEVVRERRWAVKPRVVTCFRTSHLRFIFEKLMVKKPDRHFRTLDSVEIDREEGLTDGEAVEG